MTSETTPRRKKEGEPNAPRGRRRTSTDRLRLVDNLVQTRFRTALEIGASPTVIDVGIGVDAGATARFSTLVKGIRTDARVVAYERDEGVAASAASRLTDHVCVRAEDIDALGGLPHGDAPARLIRAMNVLRSETKEEAQRRFDILVAALDDAGVVIEGSCDQHGDIAAAWVVQNADGARRQGLWCATTGARGCAPWAFRDVLPRTLRRSVHDGTPLFQHFRAWHAGFTESMTPSSMNADAGPRSERDPVAALLAAARATSAGVLQAASPNLSGGGARSDVHAETTAIRFTSVTADDFAVSSTECWRTDEGGGAVIFWLNSGAVVPA